MFAVFLNILPVNVQSNEVPRSSEKVGGHLGLLDGLDVPIIDGGDDIAHLEGPAGGAVSGDVLHSQQQLLILEGDLDLQCFLATDITWMEYWRVSPHSSRREDLCRARVIVSGSTVLLSYCQTLARVRWGGKDWSQHLTLPSRLKDNRLCSSILRIHTPSNMELCESMSQ